MRFCLILLFLIALSFLLIGCSEPDNTHYRFPLKMGNSWTYLRTRDIYNLDSHDLRVIKDTLYTIVEFRATSPDGEECFGLKSRYSSLPDSIANYEYLVNRPDGLYLLGWKYNLDESALPFKHPGSLFYPHLMMPKTNQITWFAKPLKVMNYKCKGTRIWEYGGTGKLQRVIFSILPQERIHVPSGIYTCFVKKSTYPDLPDDEQYTHFGFPGIVQDSYQTIRKYERRAGVGSLRFNSSMVLINYTVN